MKFYSYVIYNKENHRFYYGFTEDLEKAEIAHNKGLIEVTKDMTPWVMLYHENFETKKKAIWRSKFYKSKSGQNHIRKALHF